MAKHNHIHTRFNAHSKGTLSSIHKGDIALPDHVCAFFQSSRGDAVAKTILACFHNFYLNPRANHGPKHHSRSQASQAGGC